MDEPIVNREELVEKCMQAAMTFMHNEKLTVAEAEEAYWRNLVGVLFQRFGGNATDVAIHLRAMAYGISENVVDIEQSAPERMH